MGDETSLGEVEQAIYRAEVAALKAQATALLSSEAFPPGIVQELLEWLQHATNDLHYAYGIVRRAREQAQSRRSELAPSLEDEPEPTRHPLTKELKKALPVGSADALSRTAGAPPKPKRKSLKRTK